MSQKLPYILALDFDGVICDGLLEYFVTTKEAYQQIWRSSVGESFAPSFYRLRPVIETGWEMPILLRALVLGIGETEIVNDFQAIARQITEQEKLSKQTLVNQLDGVRDRWIRYALADWLGLHQFYPGVIEQLRQLINATNPTNSTTVQLYIVTTKEGRFVKQLLQQQGIDLPATQIIGKESKRPKYETLRILRDNHQQPGSTIKMTFVEDRLEALQEVAQQADLQFVDLFLADWGYNFQSDRLLASQDRRIKLLSLAGFPADLAME
jgi:phosphoglycolate phosphatase-like HAD superfamily hydrolase